MNTWTHKVCHAGQREVGCPVADPNPVSAQHRDLRAPLVFKANSVGRAHYIQNRGSQNPRHLMSAIPARIPASAFTSPRRRKHSLKGYNAVSPLKTRLFTPGDTYIPRPTMTNASITNLREAINKLDTTMASLMSQRRELELHLEQAVRLQSPVLRLPSELLSSIFLIGVLDMGDENAVMVPTLMLVWCVTVLLSPFQ